MCCWQLHIQNTKESERYKKFWPQDHSPRKTTVIDSEIHQPRYPTETSSLNTHKTTKDNNTLKSIETEIKNSIPGPYTPSREIIIPVSYVSRQSSCNSLSSSEGSMNEYDIEKESSKLLPSTPVDQSSLKGIRKITIKANCSVLDEPYNELDFSTERGTSPKRKVPEDQGETVKICVLFSCR